VKRVYLAGPPHADEYRRRAEALVRQIGWEPVDPMRRDFRGRTQGNEVEIVEGDLSEIKSCHAVLAAFVSPDEGTAMEAWYAHSLGKPVVAYTGGTPPHPWTVYVADVICDELEQAVQSLGVSGRTGCSRENGLLDRLGCSSPVAVRGKRTLD
jgi:nucleoside 2-deoxyribosyltransferase